MSKKIPFDLNDALRGDPVVTRVGDSVSQIHYLLDVRGGEMCVAAVVNGSMVTYYEGGTKHLDPRIVSNFDLFMVPPEEVVRYAAFGMGDTGQILWTALKESPQHALNSFKAHLGPEPLQVIGISSDRLRANKPPEIWDMT
jgi:hypothetical protein